MRTYLAVIMLFAFLGCSRSTAGLVLPAGEMIVLAESAGFGYISTITNRGKEAISLELVGRQDAEVVRTLVVPPGGKESVTVRADQVLQVVNRGNSNTQLMVSMSRGRTSMRLLPAVAP